MGVMFIQYEKLHENRFKRILFLNLIFKLSNMGGKVNLNELNLKEDDIIAFKDIILRSPYKNFFVFSYGVIQIIDEIDGKIVSDMDVLANDLNETNNTILEEHSPSHFFQEVKLDDLDSAELESFFDEIYPQFIIKWLFKEINLPLIPYNEKGLEIFNKSLHHVNNEKIKEIFNRDFLIKKVQFLPDRIEKDEINREDYQNIKNNVLSVIKYLEYNIILEPFDYCFKIYSDLIEAFNSTQTDIRVPITLLSEQAIFLAENGKKDLMRNKVISNFNDKKVLFSDRNSLSQSIQAGDVVLCEIERKNKTFLIVNPLKIMDEIEILSYLDDEEECGTPKSKISKFKGVSNG